MNAYEYLKQVRKIETLIRNKLIDQQRWRDLAQSITGSTEGERVQSSGSQQKMSDAVIMCVDMEVEIGKEVERLRETERDIIHTIEQVNSTTQYDVLHRIYFQGQTLLDVADAYGKDYSWATTTHKRARKSVQAILDKK